MAKAWLEKTDSFWFFDWKFLSATISSMQLSAIKQMEQYAREYEDVISLSQGIPSLPSDALIRYEVINQLLSNRVDSYSEPAGLLSLREAISEYLEHDGMSYSADEILITTGATEAMSATLLALTKPGEEVIMPAPTYAAFTKAVHIASLSLTEIELREGEGWRLDIDEIEKKVTANTKVIILCNPNNPMGSIYDQSTLVKLANLCVRRNIYLVIDEVYRHMLFNQDTWYSPCQEEQFKQQVIRIGSFSKDFSLTGWRIGYLHSDKQVVKRILPVHDGLVNCAPVISQVAALASLKYAETIIPEHLALYTKQRDIVSSALTQLSETFSFVEPQGSYFFFPKLRQEVDSMAFCMDLLRKERLALVPGTDFGKGGEGHIRICFGRDPNDVIEGMKRLIRYCTIK